VFGGVRIFGGAMTGEPLQEATRIVTLTIGRSNWEVCFSKLARVLALITSPARARPDGRCQVASQRLPHLGDQRPVRSRITAQHGSNGIIRVFARLRHEVYEESPYTLRQVNGLKPPPHLVTQLAL
jgi:hypothetical protein